MAAEKGCKSCTRQSLISQGSLIGDGPGQSRGYDMTSLQLGLAGTENCFQQSDRLGGHVDKGLHPHRVGL